MDSLSTVLQRFSITTDVFYSGSLCQLVTYGSGEGAEGHLHFLESGRLILDGDNGKKIELNEPCALFFPTPQVHRLKALPSDQATIICAAVQYGAGPKNPLVKALPPRIIIKLREAKSFATNTELLFDEMTQDRPGRKAMMNTLAEMFLINLLRHILLSGSAKQGMLAGLAHPQLCKVLEALHSDPAAAWTLEKMADLALMSRSKFAAAFKATVGQSPGEYLTVWRVEAAQSLLEKEYSVGWVAHEVGYADASALARAFRRVTAVSPRDWKKRHGKMI